MPLTYQNVMNSIPGAGGFSIPSNLLDFLRGAIAARTQGEATLRATPTADITAQIAGQKQLQELAGQQAIAQARENANLNQRAQTVSFLDVLLAQDEAERAKRIQQDAANFLSPFSTMWTGGEMNRGSFIRGPAPHAR